MTLRQGSPAPRPHSTVYRRPPQAASPPSPTLPGSCPRRRASGGPWLESYSPGPVAPDPRPRYERCCGCVLAHDIRTAGGEVVSLDPPDNRLPDAGPLTDLRIGQTSLAPCRCQDLTAAHASPPRSDRAAARPRRDGRY